MRQLERLAFLALMAGQNASIVCEFLAAVLLMGDVS